LNLFAARTAFIEAYTPPRKGPSLGARRCSCWGARRVCRMRLWTACLLRSAIVGSAGRGVGGGRGGGCGAFERVPRPRSFVGVPPRSRETKSNIGLLILRSRPIPKIAKDARARAAL